MSIVTNNFIPSSSASDALGHLRRLNRGLLGCLCTSDSWRLCFLYERQHHGGGPEERRRTFHVRPRACFSYSFVCRRKFRRHLDYDLSQEILASARVSS
jgi:hypothetical protein